MLVDRVAFVAGATGASTFTSGSAVSGFLTLAQAVSQGTLFDGQPVSYIAQDSVTAPTQAEWGHGTFHQSAGTVSRTTVLGNINSGTAGSSALNFSVAPTVYLTYLAEDTRPIKLAANATFYVSTTGSDSNTGLSSGTAWLTLQHAMDYISQNIDANSFSITVNIANGTYSGFTQHFPVLNCGDANLTFAGNASDYTQVVINSTAQLFGLLIGFLQNCQGRCVNFQDLTFELQTGWGISAFAPAADGLITLTNVIGFRNTGGGAFNGECLEIDANNFSIGGGGSTVYHLAGNNYVNFYDAPNQNTNAGFSGATFNFAAGVNWTESFIRMTSGSANFVNCVFNGSTTGGTAAFTSICSVQSALNNGDPTTFPGNSSNAIPNFGTYDNYSSLDIAVYANTKAGLPSTADMRTISGFPLWNVFKDTSGGGNYLTINDAGTIKMVAADIRSMATKTTTNYTIALGDMTNARIEMNNAGANTVTIPSSTSVLFPVGTEIYVTQVGAGATTITAGGGVTGHAFGALSGQWGSAKIYKRAADEWVQTSV